MDIKCEWGCGLCYCSKIASIFVLQNNIGRAICNSCKPCFTLGNEFRVISKEEYLNRCDDCNKFCKQQCRK